MSRGQVRAHHRQGPARWAWRYLAGLPLSGRRRSNATFLAPGSVGEPAWWGRGAPSRWSMMAGYRRALVRVLPLAVAGAWWQAPGPTLWALALIGGPGAGLAVVKSWRALQGRALARGLVRPLRVALAPTLGLEAPEIALRVTPGYADAPGGAELARLVLPDHWTAEAGPRDQVARLFADRLGVGIDAHWDTKLAPMLLRITRAQLPPAAVLLEEYRGHLDAAGADRVFLGMAAAGQSVYWDLAQEDPHLGASMGSRRGKTSMLLSLGAQLIRKGAERVVLIDPKRVSLEALAGLPGVQLLNDPQNVQAMWDAVADFRAFMEDRAQRWQADRTLEFSRAALFIDEVNAFAALSLNYWRTIRTGKMPAVPPVWADLAALAWMGAQFRCNLVLVGQRLDAQATGGQGLRDSLGVRMLAGFQPQQWGFLVGTKPVPRSQKPRGRIIVVEGGEHTWIQGVYGSELAWRDYAQEAAQGAGAASRPGTDAGPATCDTGPVVTGLEAGAAAVGLSVDAFRQRRHRAGGAIPGEFRRGNQPAWAEADLAAWAGQDATVGGGRDN